ncbi:hypothetical protein V8F06_009752 [Rhypophila decipiens]
MAPPTASNKPLRPGPIKVDTSSGSSSSVGISKRQRTQRVKSVTQACHMCRRFKARCDGARPSCSSCVSKERECRYEGEAGQSLQAAMKTRLESLERIVAALQTRPPDEADQILNRIRSADDIETVMIQSSSYSSSGRESISSSDAGMASTPSSGLPPPPRAGSGAHQPGMNHSAFLVSLIIPSATTTVAAIQSFYSSSGKLFHVFSREQVDVYYKSVFGLGLDGRPNTNNRIALCSLAAVAAVGIQYNPADFEKGSEVVFYDVARHYFAHVVEEKPLDAIKVCTMLAMYNILSKTTVSLAYVEAGLNLSRRHSLHIGECKPSSISDVDWVDYRRAWRTLLFISSWLSSTLGYISGSDESAFEKLVPLAEVEIDHGSDISETVQAEMTKISIINAEILRMHLTKHELSAEAMDSILKTLRDWHANLPSRMLLANLVGQTLTDEVRRSIYHAHLLYLGALILVYRRIASAAARSVQLDQANSTGKEIIVTLDQVTKSRAKDGIVAARYSASILGLLLAEKGIFKRCWLVIFQAHTSCVVILHAIAQKQLHKLAPSSWAEDMRLARVCLDTLAYCGELDPIAEKFQIRLSGIYNKLQKMSERLTNSALLADSITLSSTTGDLVSTSEVARRRRTEDWVTIPADFEPSGYYDERLSTSPFARENAVSQHDPASSDYLLTIPRGSDKQLAAISHSLLFALCRPWGDRAQGEPSDLASREGSSSIPFSGDGGQNPSSNYASTPQSNRVGGSLRTSDSEPIMPSWERQNTPSVDQNMSFPNPILNRGPLSADWSVSGTQSFKWDTIGMLGYTGNRNIQTTPGASLGNGQGEDREAKGCSIMTGFPISMPSSSCFLGSEEPSGWKGAVDIIMVEEVDEDAEMSPSGRGEGGSALADANAYIFGVGSGNALEIGVPV